MTTIHTLDLNFLGAPEAIAAFLLIGPAGPALIETGPGSTLPNLLDQLHKHGVAPGDIRDVLVTHIHLDHAGALGWWAQNGARVYVHHFGAAHVVDPSKLLASAQRIYGDMMGKLWGDYLPSPAERVQVLHDNAVVEVGGLRLVALDTPGHARHHLVYQLDDVAFVGDIAGIRIAGRPHTRLPTPPPEFEPEVWRQSVARLRAHNFKRLYLTHFGALDDVNAHWDEVEHLTHALPALVRDRISAGADRLGVIRAYEAHEDDREARNGLSEADRQRYSGVGPHGMSVDGILRHLKKSGLSIPS